MVVVGNGCGEHEGGEVGASQSLHRGVYLVDEVEVGERLFLPFVARAVVSDGSCYDVEPYGYFRSPVTELVLSPLYRFEFDEDGRCGPCCAACEGCYIFVPEVDEFNVGYLLC